MRRTMGASIGSGPTTGHPMEIQPASMVVTLPEGAQPAAFDRGRPLEVRLGNIVRARVERFFAWLGRNRRLAKDVENLARTALAFLHLAMIRLMLRRLARSSAAS